MFKEDEGNGQSTESLEDAVQEDAAKTAVFDLSKMKREDGIITRVRTQGGVLQSLIAAIEKDRDYRQLLMKADFMSANEADQAANAIAWALRYGVSIAPILDKIAARCAVKARRVEQILEGYTSIKFQNYRDGKKQSDYKPNQRSPLS